MKTTLSPSFPAATDERMPSNELLPGDVLSLAVMASKVETTSFGVTGLPSLNSVPFRSATVQARPSADGFHEVASRGTSSPFASRLIRPSEARPVRSMAL